LEAVLLYGIYWL